MTILTNDVPGGAPWYYRNPLLRYRGLGTSVMVAKYQPERSRVNDVRMGQSTNYLIDLDAGIIMNVEATPAHRTLEVESIKTMVQRVQERFDIKPNRLVGDAAYGSAPMLHWMVNEKGIEPHVPVWGKTQRKDDALSSSDFQWNAQANEYRCPEGHALQLNRRPFKNPRTHITQEDTLIYRASQHDCAACPRKAQCCPNTPARKIARSIRGRP